MSNKRASDELWNNRERFAQTPDRYSEVASKKSVVQLLEKSGSKWRSNRLWINYADLGCGECLGTEFFSRFLAEKVGLPVRTTGVDASPKCAGACTDRKLGFRNVELGSDPLDLKDYQVITMFETIEHVFNTDKLLESVRESISNDGLLLVTTLNVVCLKNRILVPLGIQPFNTEISTRKLSYGYKFKSLRNKMDTWQPAGHIRPFTLPSLSELLEDNGFRIIQSYGLENWGSLKVLEKIAKNMCTGIFVVAQPS
jgi:SAM-dependent methyltransferase